MYHAQLCTGLPCSTGHTLAMDPAAPAAAFTPGPALCSNPLRHPPVVTTPVSLAFRLLSNKPRPRSRLLWAQSQEGPTGLQAYSSPSPPSPQEGYMWFSLKHHSRMLDACTWGGCCGMKVEPQLHGQLHGRSPHHPFGRCNFSARCWIGVKHSSGQSYAFGAGIGEAALPPLSGWGQRTIRLQASFAKLWAGGKHSSATNPMFKQNYATDACHRAGLAFGALLPPKRSASLGLRSAPQASQTCNLLLRRFFIPSLTLKGTLGSGCVRLVACFGLLCMLCCPAAQRLALQRRCNCS